MNLGRLKGIAFFVGGISFSLWSIFVYQGGDYRYGSKFIPEGRDGSAVLVLLLIGVASTAYGYGEILFYRKQKSQESNSNEN